MWLARIEIMNTIKATITFIWGHFMTFSWPTICSISIWVSLIISRTRSVLASMSCRLCPRDEWLIESHTDHHGKRGGRLLVFRWFNGANGRCICLSSDSSVNWWSRSIIFTWINHISNNSSAICIRFCSSSTLSSRTTWVSERETLRSFLVTVESSLNDHSGEQFQ